MQILSGLGGFALDKDVGQDVETEVKRTTKQLTASEYKPEELEMNDEPDLSDIGEIQFGKTEATIDIDDSFLDSIFEDMK